MLFATQEHLLSAKQLGLLATFRGLIEQYRIKIHVNEPFPKTSEPVSVDVEHDESGTFVCVGLYVPSSNSYFGYTDIESLRRAFSGVDESMK